MSAATQAGRGLQDEIQKRKSVMKIKKGMYIGIQQMHNRVEIQAGEMIGFSEVKNKQNAVKLLKIIHRNCCQFSTNVQSIFMLVQDTQYAFLLIQTPERMNNEYHENFKALI